MTTSWRPAPGPVVCIGETMAALAPDPPSPLQNAAHLRLSVAGAESNVAMYLADHGVRATWLSAVGDDPLGRRVRATVAAAGVDVSHVRTDPHRPTGLLVKDPGPAGTRVHYYRSGSAASALGPDALDSPPMRTAALVHLTGITPALSQSCRELVTRALATADGERRYAVSFDVNHRPALWPDGTAPAVLRELADQADIVFVGLDEAQGLWGADLTAADIRALLPRPRILVVKDGASTATAVTDDGQCTVPALRTTVVEAVGAGDAFAAGFLAGLLKGATTERALRLGHITAVSALEVTRDHGPLPDEKETERLLGLSAQEWAKRERSVAVSEGAGQSVR
ncbi:carbohydrate kinase [Streptomyces spinoverrucosus]|uniref:Carbohydrate kinase n=1 Tax=Streptomyces spinoverrucosus TaxID=284043 RepID=A0A4Y3VRC6_9ACTN|nr:sugar kinase [Streptomyces spinoverrucosus]GEC08219.1 carbohydrate kinase [Streptomyces spinoverrucosus]GHB94331.1 carbohydrate kinase [Streptomyces spinoverrucosus]